MTDNNVPSGMDGLASELCEEIAAIPTVDAHEHLVPEAEALGKPADFYSLFEHYCPGDLVAAGAGETEIKEFGDRNLPEAARWERFKPYLSRIRTGSYACSALIVVRDLLGLPGLDDGTYAEVGRRLRALRQPGLYQRILRERCNIAACIQCVQLKDMGPGYFHHLAPSEEVVDVAGPRDVKRLSERLGRDVRSLDDAVECMEKVVSEWASTPRVVGIKSAHAYGCTLGFRKVEGSDASAAFRRILASEAGADPQDAGLVQDFLMFKLAACAASADLALVIHTGLQAGNYGRITDANPLLLQALIEENRGTRFDLFHGGTPWVREIAVLAKYFPNVHLNMAWMHIISPAQARAALSEWLDMVPNTKIFGFGGDYSIVEKVYGHLKMARQDIACVLAEKVREGAWSRAEASLVARRLMRDNAAEFYRISLP
jgi:predicted TIM-barrel fold metal-dependent hydrolase